MVKNYCQPRFGYTNRKNTNYYTLIKVKIIKCLNKLVKGDKVVFADIANQIGVDRAEVAHIITEIYYKKEYPLTLETVGNRRVFYK